MTKATLTLTNGNVLTLTSDVEPRIKESFLRVGATKSEDCVRILTKTQKGCRELSTELQAWGARVDRIGSHSLVVHAN